MLVHRHVLPLVLAFLFSGEAAYGEGDVAGNAWTRPDGWTRLAIGVAAGREPDVLRLPDGSLAVAWAAAAEGLLDLLIRRVAPDGTPWGEPVPLVRGWTAIGTPALLFDGVQLHVVFAGSGEDTGVAQPLHVVSGSLERGFGRPRTLPGPAADGAPDATVDWQGTPVVAWPSAGRMVVRFGLGEADQVQVLDVECCPEHVAIASHPEGALQLAWSSRDGGVPGLFTRALGADFEAAVEVPYSVMMGSLTRSPGQRLAVVPNHASGNIVVAYCSAPDCEAVYLWIGLWRGMQTEPIEVALVQGATNIAASPAPNGVWMAWLQDGTLQAVTVTPGAVRPNEIGTAGPLMEGSTSPVLQAPLPTDASEVSYVAIEGLHGPLDVVLITSGAEVDVLWYRRFSDDAARPPSPEPGVSP